MATRKYLVWRIFQLVIEGNHGCGNIRSREKESDEDDRHTGPIAVTILVKALDLWKWISIHFDLQGFFLLDSFQGVLKDVGKKLLVCGIFRANHVGRSVIVRLIMQFFTAALTLFYQVVEEENHFYVVTMTQWELKGTFMKYYQLVCIYLNLKWPIELWMGCEKKSK